MKEYIFYLKTKDHEKTGIVPVIAEDVVKANDEVKNQIPDWVIVDIKRL